MAHIPRGPQRNTGNLLVHFPFVRLRRPQPQLLAFQAPCPRQHHFFLALSWALISGQGGAAPVILSHHMKEKSSLESVRSTETLCMSWNQRPSSRSIVRVERGLPGRYKMRFTPLLCLRYCPVVSQLPGGAF